jgi:hypothetical protein
MPTFLQRLLDKIQEQAWFQQLRSKWDELDAQSKSYLQWAGGAGSILLVGWIFLGTAWNVHSIRSEIAEKEELLALLQSANEEMGELKEQIPSVATGGTSAAQPIKDYLSGLATQINVPAASLELSNEKVGSPREGSKETLAQVTLKKINVRQLVKFIFQMENGSRPMKLRNLEVATQSDESGYLDATLQVSAFAIKND